MGGEELISEVGKLIRDVWHEEEIPKKWQLAIICPIYKKGDRSRISRDHFLSRPLNGKNHHAFLFSEIYG